MPWMDFTIGVVALVIVWAYSLVRPKAVVGMVADLEQLLKRVSATQVRTVLAVAALSAALSIAYGIVKGLPTPFISDEFSYLLAADTFAHGRLTNPPHPMWMFFESASILQHPSYQSKYPPGQGLILALGQVLFGKPIFGVWLSVALACAAVTWALMAWVPKHWAAVAGFLTAFHPVIQSWSAGYWGGAVAMAGGALLIGSLGRLLTRASVFSSTALAAGLALLAFSRPFEGAALGFAALTILFAAQIKGGEFRTCLVVVWLPLMAGFVLIVIFTLYYNWSVTGSPLELPYEAYIEQYEYVPNLIFEPLRPLPNFRHEEIKKIFVDYASIFYNYGQGWDIFWYSSQKFFALLFIFLFPFPILLIAAAAIPVAAVSYRPLRILAGLLTFCFLILCTETYFHPHYAAPALPVLVIVLTCSAMQVSQWRRHDRPIGMRVIQYAALSLLLAVPMLVLKPLLRGNAEAEPSTIRNDYFPKFAAQRAAVQALIEQIPGRHLIVVHYSPDHIAHKEWVYNGADIDGSKVVWAHDMGASSNRALLNYFSDRKVWYLDADSDAQPVPYLLN